MSAISYRFKNSNKTETLVFDGAALPLKEVKARIACLKKIGAKADSDLSFVDSTTGAVLTDQNAAIPRNSLLIVSRVPVPKGEGIKKDELSPVATEMASAELKTEEERINAMFQTQTKTKSALPPVCWNCKEVGHYSSNCPKNKTRAPRGIPTTFLERDGESFKWKANEFEWEKKQNHTHIPIQIPNRLVCAKCKNLCKGAVILPCCHQSICEKCEANMPESEEFLKCYFCPSSSISPALITPNDPLRKLILEFEMTANQKGETPKSPNLTSAEPPSSETPPHTEVSLSPPREIVIGLPVENAAAQKVPNSPQKTSMALTNAKYDPQYFAPIFHQGYYYPQLEQPAYLPYGYGFTENKKYRNLAFRIKEKRKENNFNKTKKKKKRKR